MVVITVLLSGNAIALLSKLVFRRLEANSQIILKVTSDCSAFVLAHKENS